MLAADTVGDHHRRQHPITMNRRRAPLERLAKRGLLLVVNGAPIYAAASGLSGARKPPPVVDIAIESECSLSVTSQNEVPSL